MSETQTWVFTSACFMFWPTTAKLKNRQRNTHMGVYLYTVKCAVRILDPQHTTESIYYTPWSHPSIVLVCFSIVVVRLSKNKASVTPFNM